MCFVDRPFPPAVHHCHEFIEPKAKLESRPIGLAKTSCSKKLSAVIFCSVLQDADAATTESFEWLSQLRFDFDPSNRDPTAGLTVRMADAKFEYGFEFLGIGERLVQTPLTDRCMFWGFSCRGYCSLGRGITVLYSTPVLATRPFMFINTCSRIHLFLIQVSPAILDLCCSGYIYSGSGVRQKWYEVLKGMFL